MSKSDNRVVANEELLTKGNIPNHIAFIMDGNGRWASKRGLPRLAGHREGVKTVRRMVELGREIGIKYMTFYTFSAENWNRPIFEVNALMDLLLESINREIEDLKKNNVKVKVIGDLDQLPEMPRNAMKRAIRETSGNSGLTLVLALSYSARREIVKAVNAIISSGIKQVTEEVFRSYLESSDIPDPDLLVRTSGEYRLSNFLLYQIAYTEIIVTERFWPEFNREDLYECIESFQKRERRFGKISEQITAS